MLPQCVEGASLICILLIPNHDMLVLRVKAVATDGTLSLLHVVFRGDLAKTPSLGSRLLDGYHSSVVLFSVVTFTSTSTGLYSMHKLG